MLNLDIPDTEIYTLADPGLDGLIRECQDQPVITFDTETSGLDITRDMPLFWSVAFGERKICLTADTLPAFARVFGDDDKTFVGHKIKYDIHMLANRGIRVRGRWRDTSVMHALLFENEQHALKTVTKKLLGWGWSSFNETFKTKKRKVKGNQKFFIQQASAGMKHLMEETGQEPVELHVGEDSTLTKEALLWYWQHDPSALADYASNDAYGTMKLDQALQELLAKEAIFSAYPDVYSNMLELYIDTEMPFTQVLWGCERRGIFVDQEYLAKTEAPVVARLAEIEREFARKAGRVIKLTSNDALATYLFGPASENCLGLRPRRMTAGGKKGIQKPSVDEEVLKLLVDECVEAELALEHRQLKKLIGTYITKIGSLVGPDQRLHPQYNQDTARTGRLSSKQPNIQNQPTLEHDKFGIRKSFIPEPGNILLVFDYKALEMRLLAAAATEEPMIEAFRQGRDPHMANASMIFNVPYDDVVEAKKIDKKVKEGLLPESAMTQRHHDLLGYRSAAKTLGFGLVYGMREGKLARDLKITKPEAVELRKKFMGRFPAVERFLKEAVSDAIALNCKSYTYLGRRRHLPALLSRRPLDRFQAERQCNNNAIQGTAADLVRMAMLNVASLNLEDSYSTYMLMQVHDELVFECPLEAADEVFPIIKAAMEHPFPTGLSVPIEVDGGRGLSWGTAK